MTSFPTMLTCAHCGGRSFTVVILLNGDTSIRCVNHESHVQELDLHGKRQAQIDEIERRVEEESARRKAEWESRKK